MSERRCEKCGTLTKHCDCIGGPTVYPGSADGPGESAELAAIRAAERSTLGPMKPEWVRGTFVRELLDHRSSLLRIVDELTFVSESRGRRILELESYAQASAKERVELEAKLVSTEGSLRRTQEAFEAAEQAWRARVVERDAKLAEAEASEDGFAGDHAKAVKAIAVALSRAEAAEARVRELVSMLRRYEDMVGDATFDEEVRAALEKP